MNVLLAPAKTELVVKKSRFIAELFQVQDQHEAREKLHELKIQDADATHVVHAFVTGTFGEVNGMSDDGEPAGTAGRPVLEVLKGSNITNVLLTVTRYFGGTLLGTGGLVHAYSDSAKAVIALCKTEELVKRNSFKFEIEYGLYEMIKRNFSQFHLSNVVEHFGTEVSVSGEIQSEETEVFRKTICNMTKGMTEVEIVSCI